MSTDPLLSLRDLHAGYGETQVLHGVSLDVEPGEVVSLIGRNGAGKTTTLKAIAGSVPAWSGDVVYDGESIVGSSPAEIARAGIALVPEERRVFPGLTVEENLRMGELGGSRHGERWSMERVYDTFESLRERTHSNGAQLSGGEQQMLSIARALVSGPRLLLLDEPTEGLAPIIVERVQSVIEDLKATGLTVLLVEQNVRVALALADRHYILDQGEIVYTGTSEDLQSDQTVLDRHLGVTG